MNSEVHIQLDASFRNFLLTKSQKALHYLNKFALFLLWLLDHRTLDLMYLRIVLKLLKLNQNIVVRKRLGEKHSDYFPIRLFCWFKKGREEWTDFLYKLFRKVVFLILLFPTKQPREHLNRLNICVQMSGSNTDLIICIVSSQILKRFAERIHIVFKEI